MRRHSFYVAYKGSYVDPNMEGGISGPYDTRTDALNWIKVLRVSCKVLGPAGQAQPLYIIQVIDKTK